MCIVLRLANKKVYVFLYGVIGCVFSATYAYFNGTITTLEKRYHISSQRSGTISVGNDISQLLASAVLSYYAGKGHRPRWIALGLYRFSWKWLWQCDDDISNDGAQLIGLFLRFLSLCVVFRVTNRSQYDCSVLFDEYVAALFIWARWGCAGTNRWIWCPFRWDQCNENLRNRKA